jgi:membrane associated rhomboid family serine protease
MFPSLPPVTRTLIIVCVAVFLLEAGTGSAILLYFALWPVGSENLLGSGLGFQPWQTVTYSFLHGSLMHLLFNMLALFMFGGEVERLLGARRYMNLYFVSVIVAALTQLIFSAVAAGDPYPTVGASGGIFGVLLAYAVYFPNRTVVLLIPPIPLPARWFVILYGAFELYLGVTGTQEGVAHFAHLGGMLGAFLLIRYWRGRFPFNRR